jgi:hypothetical protein
MKIYKIEFLINRRIPRGRTAGDIERIESRTEIIIDNYFSAVEKFKEYRQQWDSYMYVADYFGWVRIYEPHIHEDGSLAYWPDDEIYIAEIQKDDGGEIEATHALKEEKFFVEKGELNG